MMNSQQVTEAMVEAFQARYRELSERCRWQGSWPSAEESRELLEAALSVQREAPGEAVEALRKVRSSLETELERGVITDTLWMNDSPAETIFDFIDAALSAQAEPTQVATHRIEHDGFEGTVIGTYTTREGKRGVVLQQIGTKVVHVYGEKWLATLEPKP